jgi:hypothetical protein
VASSASRRESNPVSESPWLWIACFSAMGLVALVAVNAKFTRREAAIEQRYHARQLAVPPSSADAAPGVLPDAAPQTQTVPRGNRLGLGSLAIVLVLLLTASTIALGLRLLVP